MDSVRPSTVPMAATMAATMASPMVEVVDLEHHYGQAVAPVLRGVSLNVGVGEWVALMGPSGCGKTTLLNLLAGLDRPTAGSIRIAGQSIDTMTTAQRAVFRRDHLGVVFQGFNLLAHLDVATNVQLPLRLAGARPRDAQRQAEPLLERLGLAEHRTAEPTTLSGGQQQRVALARAVIARPSLLLADEPTGSLDSSSSNDVLSLFRDEHRRGQTIVMVTHDEHVASCADRIVRLLDGRVVDAVFAS
jgi:putative ABC transport system ATP-binding protein